MIKKNFILFFKKKKIINDLTVLFVNNASTFNGLYNGIYRIACGQNKKNFKAVDEFYQRLSYLSDFSELIEQLTPFISSSSQSEKQVISLSEMILNSMKHAGIYYAEPNEAVHLTKENIMHYEEMNGDESYIGDIVKIVFPAWYQRGHILEKGYCKKIE